MSTNDWAVFRFDFNGNEVLVEKRLTEERAWELVAEFESHQHHQHYWASRLPDVPIDYAQMLRKLLNAGSPLNASLQVLRNQNASLMQCIKAVYEVRGVTVLEAKRVVLLSPAFADKLERQSFADTLETELDEN
jgi:hypothetical protein